MTDTPAPTVKVPERTLTVTVNGEERELFMSYGLLDKLVSQIRDTEQIAEIFTNANVRNAILNELLAKRTKTGKLTEAVDVDDLEVSLETIDDLLQWSVEHITSFFLRSLSRLNLAVNTPEMAQAAQTILPTS